MTIEGSTVTNELWRQLLEMADDLGCPIANVGKEVRALRTEVLQLKMALTHARKCCREEDGITSRRFAAYCGITTSQLSDWTAEKLKTKPDFWD